MNLALSSRPSLVSACVWMLAVVLGPGVQSVHAGEGEKPPIFADIAYAKAIENNKTDGKLLVVKFTAAWCAPCKMMDKTTWRDQSVVDWFKREGVAISVDVDKERAVAQANRISAMPTMVVFKGGKEIDRSTGAIQAKQLLAWLEQVKDGKTAEDRLKDKMSKPREGEGSLSMNERMQLAQELMEAGKEEAAAEEYAWLWKNMTRIEPSMIGVRGSFMAQSMQQLAMSNSKAKEKFMAIRDETEAALKTDKRTFADLDDWLVLNEVVNQPEKTLEWFDRIKNDADAEETLERSAFRLESLLEAHERWADLGRLVRNPAAQVKQEYSQLKMMKSMYSQGGHGMTKEQAEQFIEQMEQHARERSGKLYAGLLAAGREDGADKVSGIAFAMDSSKSRVQVCMVRWAVEIGRAREEHLRWLDDAASVGEKVDELRSRCETMLKQDKTKESK